MIKIYSSACTAMHNGQLLLNQNGSNNCTPAEVYRGESVEAKEAASMIC